MFFKPLSRQWRTVQQLGLRNIVDVLSYRACVKSGLMEKILPIGESYQGVFFEKKPELFNSLNYPPPDIDAVKEAEELLKGRLRYYSHQFVAIGSPPCWTYNVERKKCLDVEGVHWSKLNFFDDEIGDIKDIWEPSRFSWALVLARAYRITRKDVYLDILNRWLNDWVAHNPQNVGINWLCGQETSLRLLHIMLASFLLGQHESPTSTLLRFVREHLERLPPTMRYAKAQENNHATSEAVALFVGGSWLKKVSSHGTFVWTQGKAWAELGRQHLEERVAYLIENDGSFSQYSTNYHRLMLDTLWMAEFWRRQNGEPLFSRTFYEKAQKATDWLIAMIDEVSGDTPNLGANDGAHLFVLSAPNYRDFRPTAQNAHFFFYGTPFYPKGKWNDALTWLRVDLSQSPEKNEIFVHYFGRRGAPSSQKALSSARSHLRLFDDGGYVLFRAPSSWGLLHYPRFKHRPSQADLFHFDLWSAGQNILRDAGSFRYNTRQDWLDYFMGTRSHNTVEFDDRAQMPKMSRFLFGEWPEIDEMEFLFSKEELYWQGAYTDHLGVYHRRKISLVEEDWLIEDTFWGQKRRAILRWRLIPANWILQDERCSSEWADIFISSPQSIVRIELTRGWESKFYASKTPIPLLEIEVGPQKTTLLTRIHLHPFKK